MPHRELLLWFSKKYELAEIRLASSATQAECCINFVIAQFGAHSRRTPLSAEVVQLECINLLDMDDLASLRHRATPNNNSNPQCSNISRWWLVDKQVRHTTRRTTRQTCMHIHCLIWLLIGSRWLATYRAAAQYRERKQVVVRSYLRDMF